MYKHLKDSKLVDNLVRVDKFVEISKYIKISKFIKINKLVSLELKFIKMYKLFFNKLTYFILSIITSIELLIAL